MDAVGGFCGERVTAAELELIREVVARFGNLSRTELANTVCELLGWERRNGGLKARECLDYLGRLERAGVVKLPALRPRRPHGSPTSVPHTERGEVREGIVGEARDLGELRFSVVESEDDRRLWREWMGRYHYRGFRVRLGAALARDIGRARALLGDVLPSGGLELSRTQPRARATGSASPPRGAFSQGGVRVSARSRLPARARGRLNDGSRRRVARRGS